jgi:hypothetical protein
MKHIRVFESFNESNSMEELTFYFQPEWHHVSGVQSIPMETFPEDKPNPNDLLDEWQGKVMNATGISNMDEYEEWFGEFVGSVPIFNHTFTIKYNPNLTNLRTLFEDWGTINLPEEFRDFAHNIKLQDIVLYLKHQEGVIDVRIN